MFSFRVRTSIFDDNTNSLFLADMLREISAREIGGDLFAQFVVIQSCKAVMAKRRLRAVKSAGELRAKLLTAGIRELPPTGEIAILAAELEALHGDPADRIITATAIVHGATLVTADANLLRWPIEAPRC
jgi:predicted nucleic acid-binding protein